MKVTNGQLWVAHESKSLVRLGQVGNISFRQQLAISRLIKVLNSELQSLIEVRLKIFQKYGTQNGQEIQVPPEKMTEFISEHNELMGIETDIPFEKVPVAIPGDAIGVLTGLDIVNLEPFADITVREDTK